MYSTMSILYTSMAMPVLFFGFAIPVQYTLDYFL